MKTELTHNKNELLSVGVLLSNARKQLGLSQKAVAERLCLKVSIIRDIEEDKTPTDLALTFLRGYICSYAKLVHIPENELLPMIEKQELTQKEKVISIKTFAMNKRRRKCNSWMMTFIWLILFIVTSLTSAWWWQNHKTKQEEIITMTDQSSIQLNDTMRSKEKSMLMNIDRTLSASEQQRAIQDYSSSQPIETTQEPIETAITTPMQMTTYNNTEFSQFQATSNTMLTTTNDPATPDDPNALIMHFIADCWVEVTDAKGIKLFSGLQHKDEILNLIGQIPYQIKIGAPAAIHIQFHGKPIDLGRFIRTNQVAHLTVDTEQPAVQ